MDSPEGPNMKAPGEFIIPLGPFIPHANSFGLHVPIGPNTIIDKEGLNNEKS